MVGLMVIGLLRVLVIIGEMAIGNIIMADIFGLQEVEKGDNLNQQNLSQVSYSRLSPIV